MIRFRTLLVSAFAIATVAAVAPRAAHADTSDSKIGYPCNVNVNWQANAVGSTIFSGAGCSGNFVSMIQINQVGAPNGCSASTLASATTLQTVTLNLLQQMRAGKAIQFFETTASNGAVCTTGINFLP